MNWNPYKRIAELEALHAKNIAVLAALATRIDLLGRTDDAQARWLAHLETRLQDQDVEIDELQLENNVHISRLNNLSITVGEQADWLRSLQNQLISRDDDKWPGTPVVTTISRADVEKEAKARLKRAAYARKYYAGKKAAKAAAPGAEGAK